MLPGLCFSMMMAAGGSGSVTPDPVDWNDISSLTGGGITNTQKITGTGQTIQLRIELTGITSDAPNPKCYAYVNEINIGNVNVAENAVLDFNVSPDDDVAFNIGSTGRGPWDLVGDAEVKFKSAGSPTFDQSLDTFAFSASKPNPGGLL